jgi:hypothetical protein
VSLLLLLLRALLLLLQGFPAGGSHQGRHTTEDGPGMQSILERNDLDELMAMVGVRGGVRGLTEQFVQGALPCIQIIGVAVHTEDTKAAAAATAGRALAECCC